MRRYACRVCGRYIETNEQTGLPISYVYCKKHQAEARVVAAGKARIYNLAYERNRRRRVQ